MAVTLSSRILSSFSIKSLLPKRRAAGADLVNVLPNAFVPSVLRTVDGSYNNLVTGPTEFRRRRQPLPAPARSCLRETMGTIRPDGSGTHRTTPTMALTGSVVDSDPRIDLQPDRRPDHHQSGGGAGFVRAGFGDPGRPKRTRIRPRYCSANEPDRDALDLDNIAIPAGACTPDHPERDPGRGLVGRLQLLVHVLRPVLRPRPRPGHQGRQRDRSSSRCSRMTRSYVARRRTPTSWC